MYATIFVLTLDEIDGVSAIMPKVKKEWADQIVLVDGGSTDGTIEKAKELGLNPVGEIISFAVAGVDPSIMGIAPVSAMNKALAKAGLTIDDIDLVELNEAFAAQALAVLSDFPIPEEKLNVNGGAVALGHPIGASGTILIVKLLHEMQRRKVKRGLVSLCVGGGQGIAMVIENPNA